MRNGFADPGAEKTPPVDSVHHVINLDDQTWEENQKGQWSATPSYVYRRHLLDDAPKPARKVYESLVERANHHTCITSFESWNELAKLAGIPRGNLSRAIDWLIANYLIVKFGRSCFRIIRSETIHTQLSIYKTAYKEEARTKRFQVMSCRRARQRLRKISTQARAPAPEPGARASAQTGRARQRLESPPSLYPNSDQKRDQKRDHQHQQAPPAPPLTDVNPPTTDDDDSEKDCARKVEILSRARVGEKVALHLVKSADGQAVPIAGYEKLCKLAPPNCKPPKKYRTSAGAWWCYMLPRWEIAGPDEAGETIAAHQAAAATRPRIDANERARVVMQYIATLDDATLKQRWSETLKLSDFSKHTRETFSLYSVELMRRSYSAAADALFENFGQVEEA